MLWFNKKRIEERTNDIAAPDTNGVLQALIPHDDVTKDDAKNIPAVNAAIKFIADTISMIPIKLYSEADGVVTEITNDSRVMLLNDETGDTLNSVEFWKAIIEDYFLGKGAYAYIERRGNKIIALHYVQEEYISILKNSNPIFKTYKIQVNGKEYFPYDFVKFLRNSKDGSSGTSIIAESGLILSVAHASLKFEEQLVKKGGNKKGFLLSARNLAQAVIDDLRMKWKNLYSNNTESVVVLNNGVTFQESSNTSVEMQMNENKQTNTKEILELFSLNSDFIQGKVSNEEYNSAFKKAISPLLKMIECAINKDLLLESEKSNKKTLFFAFDTREILRGDIKTRYEAYKLAIESGLKTIDEIRYMENDPAFGIDWINLTLNTSLYNIKTGDIYTPNTNTQANINGEGMKSPASQTINQR